MSPTPGLLGHQDPLTRPSPNSPLSRGLGRGTVALAAPLPPPGRPGQGGETGSAGSGPARRAGRAPWRPHDSPGPQSPPGPGRPACRPPASCRASERGGQARPGFRWPVPGRGQSCDRGCEVPPESKVWDEGPDPAGLPSQWPVGSSSRSLRVRVPRRRRRVCWKLLPALPCLPASSRRPGPGDGSVRPLCPPRDRGTGFAFFLSHRSCAGPGGVVLSLPQEPQGEDLTGPQSAPGSPWGHPSPPLLPCLVFSSIRRWWCPVCPVGGRIPAGALGGGLSLFGSDPATSAKRYDPCLVAPGGL